MSDGYRDGYRSAHTLELPAILARLAEHASFSAGRERALALAPSPDVDEVVHRQQETSEARHLLDVKPDLRLGGVHDLRPLVDAAGRGARLLPHDLLNIRDTLDSTRRLKRSLLTLDDPLPHIADIAQRFDHCPELLSEIERCISDAGQVEDHASQTLARLRGELKVAHDRLMDRLNRKAGPSRPDPDFSAGPADSEEHLLCIRILPSLPCWSMYAAQTADTVVFC